MNSREKLLGGLVAALALVMASYFVWSRAHAAIARRQATLTNLNKKFEVQQRTLRRASDATKRLAALKKRSLPTDRERANSLYQQWLLNQVDRYGFTDPSVQVADRRTRGGYYHQSRFEINGEATLHQLTDFLATFYSSDDLHRIQQLSVKPIKGSKRLDVQMSVETISLPGSKRTTVGDLASDRIDEEDVRALHEVIRNRSMFFPVNKAPKLQSIGDQRIVKGSRLRLQAKASDPDPWDSLQIDLDGNPPEGFELEQTDEDEADLIWTPEKTGDYQIDVIVRDNGSPQQTDIVSFRVSVVDPPPPSDPPKDQRRRVVGFDDATQTFLVGTVSSGEAREAWFTVRTKGQLLKLSQGDSLDVGSFIGKISRIGESVVEISTPDGPLRVRVGQSLLEGVGTTPPS